MKENLAKVVKSTPVINSLELATRIVNAALDTKGKDILVLDVSSLFSLSDYFIIVSASSDRQVQGIANRILHNLDLVDIEPLAVEGLNEGQWVLIDTGDIIVHIFYEPLRAQYDIEGLWLKAPKLKVSDKPQKTKNGNQFKLVSC